MGLITLQDPRYFKNSRTLSDTFYKCSKLYLGDDVDVHMVMKKGPMTSDDEMVSFEELDSYDTFAGYSKDGAYQIYDFADIKIMKITLV